MLPDNSGILSVQTGWVAFQNGSLESFIPAGAVCHTRPRLGPGLPYFESASKELSNAIAEYDSTAGREGLSDIVSSVRKEDALTLWHLVVRTSGADRDLVVRRFAELTLRDRCGGIGCRKSRRCGSSSGICWDSARRTGGGCGNITGRRESRRARGRRCSISAQADCQSAAGFDNLPHIASASESRVIAFLRWPGCAFRFYPRPSAKNCWGF